MLFSRARNSALTDRNIRAGWAKAGLFPFNPPRVLNEIPKSAKTVTTGPSIPDQVSQTPTTPVTPKSAGGIVRLNEMIKQDAESMDDTEDSKQRLQRHI